MCLYIDLVSKAIHLNFQYLIQGFRTVTQIFNSGHTLMFKYIWRRKHFLTIKSCLKKKIFTVQGFPCSGTQLPYSQHESESKSGGSPDRFRQGLIFCRKLILDHMRKKVDFTPVWLNSLLRLFSYSGGKNIFLKEVGAEWSSAPVCSRPIWALFSTRHRAPHSVPDWFPKEV